jgi:LEA14-like dessication related protein
MKKTLGIILLILFVIIIAVVVWWKKSGKETVTKKAMKYAPEIRVSSMNITDIDDNYIRMVSTTVLDNNLPADIVMDSLDFDLLIDSSKVLQTTYPKKIELKKSDSATIRLPLELNIKKLANILERFEKENRDSADYTLNAHFRLKLPVMGKREFEVHKTKRLPAIREIKVKPDNINIHHFGLKNTEMKMAVNVINKNVFPIKIKDGTYNVKIEDDAEIEGKMQDMVNIPAKGTEKVTMMMKVKSGALPKLGWKILFRKKQTNFDLNFKGTVISENEMINNSTTKMHAHGTLDDLKKLMNP